MIIDLIKGKDFRICQKIDAGGVVIDVSNGSQLSSTTVSEEKQSAKTVYATCDEAITLYNGKTLTRIRDTIFIE